MLGDFDDEDEDLDDAAFDEDDEPIVPIGDSAIPDEDYEL